MSRILRKSTKTSINYYVSDLELGYIKDDIDKKMSTKDVDFYCVDDIHRNNNTFYLASLTYILNGIVFTKSIAIDRGDIVKLVRVKTIDSIFRATIKG